MSALAAGAAASAGTGGAAAGAGGFAEALAGLGSQLGEAQKEAGDFTKSFKPFTELFGSFSKLFTAAFPIFAGFTAVLKPVFGALADGIKAVVFAVPNATKWLIDFGKEISQFVRLASPVAVQQFNLALDDLYAVIGRALTPALELVTKIIRSAADSMGFLSRIGGSLTFAVQPLAKAFQTVYEVMGRLGNVIATAVERATPTLHAIGEAFAALVKAVEPLADLLVDVFGYALGQVSAGMDNVVVVATVFARVLGDLTTWLARVTRELLALVGINLPNESGTKPGSSVGAAARSANVGSLESSLNKALASAFSLGTGAAPPEARTASAAEAIRAKVDLLYAEAVKLGLRADFIAGAVSKAIDSVLRAPVDAVRSVADPLARAGDEANDFLKRNFGFSL